MTEPHFDPLKSIHMERIKNHNNAIEAKYLDHELNKFKKEISMTRSRLMVVHDNLENNSLAYEPLDNTKLFSSFSHGHECVEDFYRDSENASLMGRRICEHYEDSMNENIKNETDKEGMECIDDFMETRENEEMTKIDERYVRFGDLIEIIDYDEGEMANKYECGDQQLDNLTEDIEIEPVLEVKLVPKEQICIDPILELVGKPMQHAVDKTTMKLNEKPIKINVIEGPPISSDEIPPSNQNPFIITRLHTNNQPKSTIIPPNTNNEFRIPPEQNAIVLDLFTKDIQNENMHRNTLQKYFLRWIHFTTIEKIAKENISCNQSRIQKIETFLNNIRLEKKKQIRKDSRIVDVKKKIVEPENPVVLARKYHHK